MSLRVGMVYGKGVLMIYAARWLAARVCELWSWIFRTRAPLTRDFIDIGRVSYFGDTSKMKADLVDELRYRTIHEGKETLV